MNLVFKPHHNRLNPFLGCKYARNAPYFGYRTNLIAILQKMRAENSFCQIYTFLITAKHKKHQTSSVKFAIVSTCASQPLTESTFWKNAKDDVAHHKPPNTHHSVAHRTIESLALQL